jgi:hypothetical protein
VARLLDLLEEARHGGLRGARHVDARDRALARLAGQRRRAARGLGVGAQRVGDLVDAPAHLLDVLLLLRRARGDALHGRAERVARAVHALRRRGDVARALRDLVGGALDVLDQLAQLLQHDVDGAREVDGLVGEAAARLDVDLGGEIAAADPVRAGAQRPEVRGELPRVDPAEPDAEQHRDEERAPAGRAEQVQRGRDGGAQGGRRGETEHELLRQVEPHEAFPRRVSREMRARLLLESRRAREVLEPRGFGFDRAASPE